MGRWQTILVAFLWLAAAPAYAAGGVPMLDSDGVEQGSAKVNLAKGSVSVKATLAPLPATIDTGTVQFEATIYKAYLRLLGRPGGGDSARERLPDLARQGGGRRPR